jgi:hypothetical protein
MVTATNGGGSAGGEDPRFTSTAGNAAGFVATGIPQTPSVSASTPNPDYTATLTVRLGDPRSSAYTGIRWSSSGGGSGTHAYSGGAGTVTFRTSTLGVGGQTFTVWAVNAGGVQSAPARSDSVTVYGPTKTPTGLSNSLSGTTITWSWNTPQNGRPIDQTQVRGAVDQTWNADRTSVSFNGQEGSSYQLEVRTHSAAGWSGWAGPSSRSIPKPPPTVYNVRRGPWGVASRGFGDCVNPSIGCPSVNFSIKDFPAGSTWSVTCDSNNGQVDSPYRLTVSGSGDSYSWSGKCYYASGSTQWVSVTLSNGSGSHSARTDSW